MSTRKSIKKRKIEILKENSVKAVEVKAVRDDDVEKVVIGLNVESVKSEIKIKKIVKEKVVKKQIIVKIKEEGDNKEDSDENEANEVHEKPTGLYGDDDVAGNEICSFQTPKKKKGMIEKAIKSASKSKVNSGTPKSKVKNTPNRETPKHTLLTPSKRIRTSEKTSSVNIKTPHIRNTQKKAVETPSKTLEVVDSIVTKTPYHFRNRQKKAIQAYVKKEVADSDSDSDYDGDSDVSSSESECSESDISSDSGKGSEEPACRRSLRFQQFSSTPSRKRGKDINYVFTADKYFESKFSKCTTSDRNLSSLKTPRLDISTLNSLLTKCSVSSADQKILADKRAGDPAMFQRWMFALSQGFNVLTYGLGSKFKILQSFHQQMLADSHVIVINGFFPSLNIKEIVEMLARDLLGLKKVLPSAHAIIDWIEGLRWQPRVFLIVHNLDAEMLRCERTQLILSRLASLPRVHLVASVDHINCPLLWDQAKLSAFNFIWEDTTSFLPYEEETSYETSLMVKNSGSLVLSSLLNVYRSLTQNSRGVFRIIVEKYLDENNPKYQGMPFSALYSRCRQEMLVTSDLALRTMLTEFLDHEMVKWRRDGEHLYIPTELSLLRQFHKLIQDT